MLSVSIGFVSAPFKSKSDLHAAFFCDLKGMLFVLEESFSPLNGFISS